MDILRNVLSKDYQPAYDMALAELAAAGVCDGCARKLALAKVLAKACKVVEERRRVNLQLAEHGVVLVENHDKISPCFP